MGMDLTVLIYQITENFPSEEKFGLVKQLRCCAASVPSNIAEGWNRDTQPNLANGVRMARGSLGELDTQLELSRRLGFVTSEQTKTLDELIAKLNPKLYRFLRKVEETYVREELTAYGEEFGLGD